MSQCNPIGVFDSGVGGLTVLRTLREEFPHENFIYLGDTAHVPYGGKSRSTLLKLVTGHLNFFDQQKVKALIFACNTASTLLDELPRTAFPILGVIKPGAIAAVNASKTQIIGVIATPATIRADSYQNEIQKLKPKAVVINRAGPLLVPLAEEGWIDDPVTNLIVQRYCNIFLQNSIDTLILGCTHYPILKQSFTRIFSDKVALIESGKSVSSDLKSLFEKKTLLKNSQPEPGRIVVTITDPSSEQFTKVMRRILEGQTIPDVHQIST